MAAKLDESLKSNLLEYCQNILSEIDAKKEDVSSGSGDSEQEVVLTVYQEMCQSIYNDIVEVGELKNRSTTENFLRRISQLVLDLTYVDECTLVDDMFPPDTAWTQVMGIIESLTGIEKLGEKAQPQMKVTQSLDLEIVECLRWRKGALLYMYCNTLNARCSDEDFPPHYKQCLVDGIAYLTAMLCTRTSPSWLMGRPGEESQQSVASEDHDTTDLIDQGILSDTHLLALMYCGEMCYWYAQAKTNGIFPFVSKNAETSSSSPKDKHQHPVKTSHHYDKTKVKGTSKADSRELPVKVGIEEQSGISQRGDSLSSNLSKTSPESMRHPETSCGGSKDSFQHENTDHDIVNRGQLCLEKYINVANGPLAGGGWNTTRAEELLQFFSSL